MSKSKKVLSLREIVGGGYTDFWRFQGRYRAVKGSRGSKKSKTTALWYITNMMKHPDANTLVVRKVGRTLKDSCFTELRWAIKRLGVEAYWHVKESPLEMTYKPTGQKIYFRGLDDPLKVTSITVETGSLCWLWIEEAYEITKEADFDMLDESIRGEVADGLFKQITLTFNPWNEKHWLKRRFFDVPDPDTLAKTTNYLCNEFLDEADRRLFERMKRENPRRYRVAGLGEWGIVDGLVFENWEEKHFDIQSDEFRREHPGIRSAFGLDYGYTNDPTAFVAMMVDKARREIYVFDEICKYGMRNRDIYAEIFRKGFAKERIIADCAEPKSNDELRDMGLNGIRKSRKGGDAKNNAIQWIQGYKIYIHPSCVNFITEISSYTWAEDKLGNKLNKTIDGYDHCMDAMRYALEGFIEGDSFSFD